MNRDDLRAMIRKPGAALLDGWSDAGRWTIALPEPREEFRAARGEEAQVDRFLRGFRGDESRHLSGRDDLPFSGGWVGFLAYELGAGWEGARPRSESVPEPVALFFRHDSGWAIDPGGAVAAIGEPGEASSPPQDERSAPSREAPELSGLAESLSLAAYDAAHAAIRAGIARGDFYQVNLTNRYSAAVRARLDPRDLYRRLAGDPPPPYSLLLRDREFDVVGASPELFLRADFGTRRVEMRPIKGTAPRSADPGRDAELALGLLGSAKDRAENVMIVDLCRNDLGRVCETGSVDVTELCGLRSHRVHHLESTVAGILREGVSAADLLRATFPPGSVTGAPKRAAVQAIRELEPAARGIYTGAAGYFDDRGRMAFNVAIRTAVSTDREIRYHAGGGITWDSVAALEREEAGWKARDFLALFPGPP